MNAWDQIKLGFAAALTIAAGVFLGTAAWDLLVAFFS